MTTTWILNKMNIYKYNVQNIAEDKKTGATSGEIEYHHLAGINDIYKKGEIFLSLELNNILFYYNEKETRKFSGVRIFFSPNFKKKPRRHFVV